MPGFNPFRYRFPYTNINDINLDWIIKKVKALSEAVASIDVSRMDEIAEQAETAQQDAETALAAAQSAETTANSVQGIANNALTTAQSAQTAATQAATDAQTANNNALSAIDIGDNAATIARQARSDAQSAQTAATALDASKADKVSGATVGNFAGLTANGNLADSGHDSTDFAAAAAGVPPGGAFGQVLTKIGSADYAAAWQAPSGGGGDVSADMIGIVINGNSTPAGAALGQYVIVKNSTISGITDGLYTAALPIPANTAIDVNYLTPVSGGGLNDLSKLEDVTSYLSNINTTILASVSAKKAGRVINIQFETKFTTITDSAILFYIGEEIRGGTMSIPAITTLGILKGAFVNWGTFVNYRGETSEGLRFYGSFTYLI